MLPSRKYLFLNAVLFQWTVDSLGSRFHPADTPDGWTSLIIVTIMKYQEASQPWQRLGTLLYWFSVLTEIQSAHLFYFSVLMWPKLTLFYFLFQYQCGFNPSPQPTPHFRVFYLVTEGNYLKRNLREISDLKRLQRTVVLPSDLVLWEMFSSCILT